jgi:phosphoglycolate phosphatase
MPKQHILFDLDGTLTDPFEGITKSFEYALNSFDIQVGGRAELRKLIGPPLRASFTDVYGFSEQDAETAVAKYREYYSETGIFENSLYPGIPELLAKLTDSGKLLALATSKASIYAAQILEHFNIARYFSFVAGSELNGDRSEKAELIQYALDNLVGATPGNSIMVGDRRHDIIGANSHKMDSVGVLYGYGGEAELRSAGASRIADSVEALGRILLPESPHARPVADSKTFPLNSLDGYKYVVIICTRSNGKWLLSKHKAHRTWEFPGGHIEPGETPLDAAKRELWEETGAVKFELTAAFDYAVLRAGKNTEISSGQIFYAEVTELAPLSPEFEMSEVKEFSELPEDVTYPDIYPVIFAEMQNWLKNTRQ